MPAGVFAKDYDLVKSLGIMTGYDDGNFGEGDSLTRSQFAKIVVTMVDREFTPYKSVSPYGDVPHTHWAASYIAYATEIGLLSGYPDGTFKPEKEVTYEEACKVLLNLLKYETSPGGDWATAQINAAKNAGILNNVTATAGASLLRGDAAIMVQNSLLIKPKNDSRYYIETLNYRYFQNAVIMTDKTTSRDKVLTSAGIFGKGDRFSESDILKCGDLIVDEYDNIAAFLPKEQILQSYVVKAVLPGGIATFDNDMQIEIEDDVKVFSGEVQSSYQAVKSDIKTGDRITLYKDINSKTEYISIEKDVIEGPVTNYGSSFMSAFGIDANTKIIRDGIPSDASAIRDYDICYYIKQSNTVLAYTKKKTGIYENALPNKDNPTKIILSGESYEIGSIAAFNKLSSDGGIKFGDPVTVLFGKDDKIADVLTTVATDNQVAYLINTGLKENTNEKGEKVYRYIATLAMPDGSEIEYGTDKDYGTYKGKLVYFSFSGGKAVLTVKNPSNTLAGRFDWGNKTLGKAMLASDIKILDTARYEQYRIGKYVRIFPQRLDGVEISRDKILYAENNEKGKISVLILNNVTNDMFSFGLVTKAVNQSGGMMLMGEYDLLVGGEKRHINTVSVIYQVYGGQPALFDFEGQELKGIKPLTALPDSVKNIDNNFVYTVNSKFPLSDKVVVYKKTTDASLDYEVIPLSEVMSNNYTVTAYCDKTMQSGGRIRVLVVTN